MKTPPQQIKLIYTKEEEGRKAQGELPKIKYAMRPSGETGECLLFSQQGLIGFLGEILRKYGKEAVLQIGAIQITSVKDEEWPENITKENIIEEPEFPNGSRQMSIIDVLALITQSMKKEDS